MHEHEANARELKENIEELCQSNSKFVIENMQLREQCERLS